MPARTLGKGSSTRLGESHPSPPASGQPSVKQYVKEPGCRQFDVLFEDSDPHHVFLYEVYDDATALEAHRATAHFKKYWETTAPMIAKRVARHMSPIGFNIKAR